MNYLTAAWGVVKGLFGSGGSGKSIVQTTADIVDNYKPGEVTLHNMAIEDVKTGDASQDSARKYEPVTKGTDWFNRLVDGLNRLPRPLLTFWAFGLLIGVVPVPTHLMDLNPVLLDIIWSIVGFYFGIRTISQDLPKLIQTWYQMRGSMKVIR